MGISVKDGLPLKTVYFNPPPHDHNKFELELNTVTTIEEPQIYCNISDYLQPNTAIGALFKIRDVVLYYFLF